MKKRLTLIELIITVMVLGLLTALAIPQFVGTKANADVASFKNDIDVLHKAVDEMFIREERLPLGERVTVTNEKLLDVIYASGDSGKQLYKVDLGQSNKYHMDLKTPVDAYNYFIYSKETGRIFYTNGMVDGDKKVHYTMDYIGVSNLKIKDSNLVTGMNILENETIYTLTGNTLISSKVEIKINGINASVTYENVALENGVNIMASIKDKGFSSELNLNKGKNILTLKVDNFITNFTIFLEGSEETTNPTAVISMTPEQNLTTKTNIVWGYENSAVAEGRTITAAEWEGEESIYVTEGSFTVRLRVQDSTGVWSDWAEKNIVVLPHVNVKSVAAGQSHTLILKEDGTLWATGYNAYGQLGAGDHTDRSAFVLVQSNVRSVVAGIYHTFIIKDDGTLWAAGYNNYNLLGISDSMYSNVFTQVQSNVKSVATNDSHTLVLKEDGTLWTVGRNSYGQLGTGDTTNKTSFTQVQSGVKSMAAGQFHSLAIKEDGTLWATGYNTYGQLGNGTRTNRTTFVQVQTGVKSVAAGHFHSAIIKNDGTLWVTGYNYYGQLGTGNITDRMTFIQVQSGVKNVAAISSYTLILKDNGSLWSTGYNTFGQLGTDSTTDRNTFAQVNSGVESIATGFYHAFVIKSDKSLWSTGYNFFGQLGTGDTTQRNAYIQAKY